MALSVWWQPGRVKTACMQISTSPSIVTFTFPPKDITQRSQHHLFYSSLTIVCLPVSHHLEISKCLCVVKQRPTSPCSHCGSARGAASGRGSRSQPWSPSQCWPQFQKFPSHHCQKLRICRRKKSEHFYTFYMQGKAILWILGVNTEQTYFDLLIILIFTNTKRPQVGQE